MSRALNWKASPSDTRDYLARTSLKLSAPVSVDLSKDCTSVKDQANIGSCTAFACVGMIEHFLRKSGKSIPDDMLSELFLYYNTRVLIDKTTPDDDCGAFLRDVLKCMAKYGVCGEKLWPYQTSKFATPPPTKAYTDGLNYQVLKYATVPTAISDVFATPSNKSAFVSPTKALEQMKALLAVGQTFVGGVTCFANFFSDRNGVIPLPRGPIIGGHALLFVGYDDRSKVLKFKNSWGPAWGDKGYGYLPYAYVLSNNLNDVWTIYSHELNNQEVKTVIRPAVRNAEIKSRLANVMLAFSALDPETGKPGIFSPKIVSNVKLSITSDPSNGVLLDSDITYIIDMVEGMAASVTLATKKLGM